MGVRVRMERLWWWAERESESAEAGRGGSEWGF